MTDIIPAEGEYRLISNLTQPQKAAIIIGALGPDAASPILEKFDEAILRTFATAMSQLRNVKPDTVEAAVKHFVHEISLMDRSVRGGMGGVRDLLQPILNNASLQRIIDHVDMPSVHNVWEKLAMVDDQALSEFLRREHPQTAAVVLSKLSSEHAARVLSLCDSERARDIVMGITKASSLDANVVEAIGSSVSNDFLARQRGDAKGQKPAERVGGIMNYVSGEIRKFVLDHLEEKTPEFADEVKRKMFTFEDIPVRVERRDIAAVVRIINQEDLLKALAGAAENAPETKDFILSGISSRVAEQIREDLTDLGKVKKREAEEAQSEVIKAIRQLESQGDLKLIALED